METSASSAAAGPGKPQRVFLLPSRQIVSQNGSDLLQHPIDLIAGDHKWRGDANRVSMGILGENRC